MFDPYNIDKGMYNKNIILVNHLYSCTMCIIYTYVDYHKKNQKKIYVIFVIYLLFFIWLSTWKIVLT